MNPRLSVYLLTPEIWLQLLQRFIKNPNQINQIHSLLITHGQLLHNPISPKPFFNPHQKTTLIYNTLIRSHLITGQIHETFILFTQMLSNRIPPNNLTFTSVIKAFSKSTILHAPALKWGVLWDPFVQTSLLRLYAELGDSICAYKMFDEISNPCIVACNAMLDAFGRNGDMGSSLLLFQSMYEKDVVSWTSVINGFARNGCFNEAISIFVKMMVLVDKTVKPNEATYVNVLFCLANLDGSSSYTGKQIHGYIVKNELALSCFMGTALIDFYGKSGCLNYAIKVFNQMGFKKVCTWNAMISSLACNGNEMQALDMFEDMKMQKLHPNEVTFVAILTACARAKLVELGTKLFESMLCEYGVWPKMEHYGCMVDLLGRAGLLSEATELLRVMPFEPDGSVLGALLGACKIHGDVRLGNEIGRRLLEVQPKESGRYVVLSNINAMGKRWSHAADLRQSMRKAGVKKRPGYTMFARNLSHVLWRYI